MPGDELDELFRVKPEEFTALRTKLATAAKKRGDAAEAKRISAARRPTTAAWVVNLLASNNEDVKHSLTDMGERLRAAHAAMDGPTIRELSAEQRSLVDELARAAVEGAELTSPTATLREDVTATLQAAIADPDVAARLGRLAKAEKWSGFGEFGDTTAVFTAARGTKTAPTPESAPKPPHRRPTHGLDEAKVALAAAEKAKGAADEESSVRQADLAVARLRRDEMRQRLEEAERNLSAAEEAYAGAKQAGKDAAAAVKEAKARLRRS